MINKILPIYNYKVDFICNTKILNPDEVPYVKWPFRNVYDDKNIKLNVVLITAPFRTDEEVDIFNKYIEMGCY